MGYEVTIKYHKKLSADSYQFDVENFETKTFRVGKKNDEVSRGELAKAIIKQLSRRDILVSDVDVVEYVKQAIKVRPTNNGIVIGNKKYVLDDVVDCDDISIIDDAVERPTAVQSAQVVPLNATNTFLKYSYFCPQPHEMLQNNQYKKMGVTVNNKYKVLREDFERGNYVIINDFNSQLSVPLRFFQDSDPNSSLYSDDNALVELQSNTVELDMPVLRG